jgi:hypothetical protein
MDHVREEMLMQLRSRYLGILFFAVAIAVSAVNTGCVEHRYARVYDPYYHDYHRWNPGEDAYYHRWEGETHRQDREFRDRNPDEQRQYWAWRHTHDHDNH